MTKTRSHRSESLIRKNRWTMVAATAAVSAAIIAACGPKSDQGKASTPQSPSPATQAAQPQREPAPAVAQANKVEETTLNKVGLDQTAMDTKANPCQDFYQYACGGWVARTKIPADRTRWMRSFSEIYKRNEQALKTILETASSKKQTNPIMDKIGRFYKACMDEKVVEQAGLKPLKPLLKAIRRVRSRSSLAKAIMLLHEHRIWALFDIGATQDFKDATKMIVGLDQNGLGLPDRGYYIRKGAKADAIRKKYVQHVAAMLKLSGLSQRAATRGAKAVMKIETQIATISKTRVQRRDPKGIYNKVDRVGLKKLMPSFSWASYFKALGYPHLTQITVTSVPFFKGIEKLLHQTKANQWRVYLLWQLLHRMANALPKAFVQEHFKLVQALTGQKVQRARWKRCVSMTDGALGELLAQPYVQQHFTVQARQNARHLIMAISDAFAQRLTELAWMDQATKKSAAIKLHKMAYLIGFPSKWRHYDYAITGTFAANVLAAKASDLQWKLGQVGKPVDRTLWEMTPPTVNAYYEPTKNQMVFPAGILQPPFYDPKAAVAVNLGGMGMVVGHELTHGFDDQGSQFNADGTLANWWTANVSKKFKVRTGCIVHEFGTYQAVPGVKLNGKLTAGENIADLGGVTLAFRAYRALRAKAAKHLRANGFNEDQMFFLAVAQVWCSKVRPAMARLRARTDPHSPPRWRVNGTLRNVPAFAKAFSCHKGTFMNPNKICQVW